MTVKRIVNVSVLPGEPTDGSGKVCIHLFVQDAAGAFTEPCVTHVHVDEQGKPTGKLIGRATRGRLACNPRRTVEAATRRGVTVVTPRTDDPRAVTCPKCIASPEYVEMMELVTAAEAGR